MWLFKSSATNLRGANIFLYERFEDCIIKIDLLVVNLIFISCSSNLRRWIWFSPHDRQIYSGEFDFHHMIVKSTVVNMIFITWLPNLPWWIWFLLLVPTKPRRCDIIVAICLKCSTRAPKGVTLFWWIELKLKHLPVDKQGSNNATPFGAKGGVTLCLL